ncbi:uncharacterized protein LOC112557508 isoform X2 [Pomacea canaliculata]|uniref:uncharacterized protein LOC112557508 isoform X2 n=1 Tax=Pomacea canaliculata TaxID=400727 RepID=UPI000D725948|nr:uncharacterized protein LOC112557508 isoform X2 [Pomacea canaliculata]
MVLQEYLAFCRGALDKLYDFPAVHIVMGNEACDLDSATSAITYAFYLHEISVAPLGTVIFFPILSMKRGDFRLRTEITYYFRRHGIVEEDLIFLDDIDLLKVKDLTDLKVTLVDHHVLPLWLSALEENVVQIIDHRPQDGSLPDRCQESTLELVGSCCTLVAEALLSDETFPMDETVASLLYGAIVTDTINFSPLAGRSTPKDEMIADQLETFLPSDIEKDALFDDISKAKCDLSGLTTEEILHKDLKIVCGDSLKVAMSSVTADIMSFMDRSDFERSLKIFASDCGVDAVVVLTVLVNEDGSVNRQLGIFSTSRVYREQMADVLQASNSPHLGLSPLPIKHQDFLPFCQDNFKASRKQILPIIKGFLAGETTPDENQAEAFSVIPHECSEGFTSMTDIISGHGTSEGDITPEDLISCAESIGTEASDDISKLQERKVFDPLSSVHSSDSVSSPSDFTTDEIKLPVEDLKDKPGLSNDVDYPNDKNWNSPIVASFEELDIHMGEIYTNYSNHPITVTGEAEKHFDNENENSPLSADLLNDEIFSSVPVFSVPPLVPTSQVVVHTDEIVPDGQDSDPLEHDVLGMTSPHDLLLQDSPPDLSPAVLSGQTSGHESKTSSYPVTPPNSYVEFDFSLGSQEVNLPSFNSSEMVEKIQEKKAALREGEEANLLDVLSPFTPQNSYSCSIAESGYAPDFFKETSLPSFRSSDMVQRIQEKRTSMERELGLGADSENLLDAMKSPFTPPNSFVEGSFDAFAREHLTSLNSAEISSRIKRKQAEMGSMCNDDTEIHSVSPPGLSIPGTDSAGSPSHPYTPQNSYKDSALGTPGHHARVTDLYEVAERLSLTESDSSGSSNNIKATRATNKTDFREQDDADSLFIGDEAQDYRVPFGRRVSNSLVSGVKESSQRAEEGNILLPNNQVGNNTLSDEEEEQGEKDELEEDEALKEIAVQKIAFELANEMIQKALETFPSEYVSKLVPDSSPTVLVKHPSISDDSPPTLDDFDSDASMTESMTAELVSGRLEPDLSDRDVSADEASGKNEHSWTSNRGIGTAGSLSAESSKSLFSELASALRKGDVHDSLDDSKAGYASSEQSILSSKDDRVKDDGTFTIETEYLHELDPLQKGLYQREATVIETDADKEVAEASSFRKISGQEYQTVQEDIMEQIWQEARDRERIKRQQCSVAEEPENVDSESSRFHAEIDMKRDTCGEGNSETDEGREEVNNSIQSEPSFSFQLEREGNYFEDDLNRSTRAPNVSDTKTSNDLSGQNDCSSMAESDIGCSTSGNIDDDEILCDSELEVSMLAFSSPVRQSHPDVINMERSLMEDLQQQTNSEACVKRVVHPETDISLDESISREQGKKTIHIERDRELYISTLNNLEVQSDHLVGPAVSEAECNVEQTLDESHSTDEQVVRRKIGVDMLSNSSFLEYQQERADLFSKSESGSMMSGEKLEESDEITDERSEFKKKILTDNLLEQTVSAEADKMESQKKDQLKGMELRDEWQDDELPNIVGEGGHVTSEKTDNPEERGEHVKRRLVPAAGLVSGDHLDDVEVLDSDSEIDSNMDNEQLEWENDTPVRMRDRTEEIPEYTAEEERRDSKSWKLVQIADMEFCIDMRVIEPYKRVLSHGGYYGEGLNAIIVFSGCYLPSRDRKDYSYVMDHLFYYVIHTLDELVADDYMIVYFHGATPRRQMPNFGWLKKCYQSIDRKLKKNLKALFLVHPTLWLKTVVLMTRPFISSKFSSKLQFVRSLEDLRKLIPMEYVYIPEQVQGIDHLLQTDPSTLQRIEKEDRQASKLTEKE